MVGCPSSCCCCCSPSARPAACDAHSRDSTRTQGRRTTSVRRWQECIRACLLTTDDDKGRLIGCAFVRPAFTPHPRARIGRVARLGTLFPFVLLTKPHLNHDAAPRQSRLKDQHNGHGNLADSNRDDESPSDHAPCSHSGCRCIAHIFLTSPTIDTETTTVPIGSSSRSSCCCPRNELF